MNLLEKQKARFLANVAIKCESQAHLFLWVMKDRHETNKKKLEKKIVCFKVQNSVKISHFLLIFVHEFHRENKRKKIMLYTVGKEIYSST